MHNPQHPLDYHPQHHQHPQQRHHSWCKTKTEVAATSWIVHSSNQSSPDGAEIKYKYGRQIKPCRTRIIAICVFTQSYIFSKSMRNIVAHIVVLCSRLTAVTFQVKKSYHVRYSQKWSLLFHCILLLLCEWCFHSVELWSHYEDFMKKMCSRSSAHVMGEGTQHQPGFNFISVFADKTFGQL